MLADTYAGWSGSFPPAVVKQRLAKSLPDLDLPAEEVVAKWIPGLVSDSAPDDVVRELASIVSGFNRDGMRVMIRSLADADLRAVLPTIEVPVLLIWGELDVRSPLNVAEAMRSQLSTSRLLVLQDAGHLSHLQKPMQFNAELRTYLGSAVRR